MSEQYQEMPEFHQDGPTMYRIYEQTQSARSLLTDVYFTDRTHVREPAELAKRLFGVARAVTDIVRANTTESRLVRVANQTVGLSWMDLSAGAFFGALPEPATAGEMFVAQPGTTDSGYGAMLSFHTRRSRGRHSLWELNARVTIPRDDDIINKLYGEPPVMHDMRQVFSRAKVERGGEGDVYPFYSPEYHPGVTEAYLGVLQGLCKRLLRATVVGPMQERVGSAPLM